MCEKRYLGRGVSDLVLLENLLLAELEASVIKGGHVGWWEGGL